LRLILLDGLIGRRRRGSSGRSGIVEMLLGRGGGGRLSGVSWAVVVVVVLVEPSGSLSKLCIGEGSVLLLLPVCSK
jgi:hypothetical protein